MSSPSSSVQLTASQHSSAAVPRAAVWVSVSFVSSGGEINEMNEPSLVNESLLRQRLTDLEVARTWAPDVLAGLEHFIRTADDYDLFRVNPIQYAGASGLSEAEGIELFVHAAKVG